MSSSKCDISVWVNVLNYFSRDTSSPASRPRKPSHPHFRREAAFHKAPAARYSDPCLEPVDLRPQRPSPPSRLQHHLWDDLEMEDLSDPETTSRPPCPSPRPVRSHGETHLYALEPNSPSPVGRSDGPRLLLNTRSASVTPELINYDPREN